MKLEKLKIAVLIPDRGDRPEFLENCLRMIKAQTVQPDLIHVINYAPRSEKCDITERYRTAYHALDGMNYDCILFMENDDFYSKKYIETMISKWIENGKPELFGTNYTYYYHIGLKRYMKLTHFRRASMMNTLIKPDLNIKWPVDDYPYTDAAIWQVDKFQIENKCIRRMISVDPGEIISIGIKHNVGMAGGHYHNNRLERYDVNDSDFNFLESVMDNESFTFYKSQHEKIQSKF